MTPGRPDPAAVGPAGRLPGRGARAYDGRVTLVARGTIALAGAVLWLAVGCYDGDHLGFVPCQASDECDAPPRATTRRVCLRAQGLETAPGYCALPCKAPDACAGEAPGTAEQDATCVGVGTDAAVGGYCALPCSAAEPGSCPAGMQCRSYAASAVASDCDDDASCVCFPIPSGDEG